MENGLVDRLGGLDDAVEEAKMAAGLDADENVSLVHYPKKQGLLSTVLSGNFAALPRGVFYRWFRREQVAMTRLLAAEMRLMEVPVP